MRLRRHSFLILFAVAVVFLFLSAYKQAAVENPAPASITKLSGQPATKEKKMQKLEDEIKKFKDNLSIYFADDNFDAIADLFGEGGVIVTPGYKRIQGKGKVKIFWSDAKEKAKVKAKQEKGEVKLELKTANIFMSDEIGPWKVIINGEEVTYDSVAYVVTEIRIVVKKSGETVKNATLESLKIYMHREDCSWFDL